MDNKMIAHDITLALLQKSSVNATPEDYVKSYFDLLPVVSELVKSETRPIRHGEILNRSDYSEL